MAHSRQLDSQPALRLSISNERNADSAAYGLLQSWLSDRPDPRIVTAWKDYVHELARLMPKETITSMGKSLMNRATQVASAAGGFLGLATISKHERAKLDELSKAWEV